MFLRALRGRGMGPHVADASEPHGPSGTGEWVRNACRSPLTREQDTVSGAKLDTTLLVGPTTITQDDSQELTDLTASGAGGYELASVRGALVGPRTLTVRWTATAAEVSTILAVHGPTGMADFTWAAGTDASGHLYALQNAVVVWTAAAPVAAKDYTLAWTLRPNPDTTVAGDAVISEFAIYSHTDGLVVELEAVAHAAPTTNAAWDLSVGGWWDGAALFLAPINAVTLARVSTSAHSLAEEIEDAGDVRPVYAGTDDSPTEPSGPMPVISGIGAVGAWAGRDPWGRTAAHAVQAQRRNWCAPVNVVYTHTPAVNMTTPANWLSGAPDAPTYAMLVQTLGWCTVPLGATHARVRVHTHTDEGSILVRLRVYAFNRLPGQAEIDGQLAPAAEYYSRQVSILRLDAGDGAWNDLGVVRLPTFKAANAGWPGTVHLVLAMEIDPADNEDINLNINAWHAVPVFNATVGVFDP